jgi:bacteriocin-like protein
MIKERRFMMTNEKMMALNFVELTEEELQNVVGGGGFLGGLSEFFKGFSKGASDTYLWPF